MSYRQALEVLRALPSKRLAFCDYYNHENTFCAVGALVGAELAERLRGRPDMAAVSIFEDADEASPARDPDAHAFVARMGALGLSRDEAEELQMQNDWWPDQGTDETPEQRYARVVAWLEAQVAKEGA